jgi:hypothetical protein
MLIEAGARGEMDVEILCDDRNIVRRMDEGWRVYGIECLGAEQPGGGSFTSV